MPAETDFKSDRCAQCNMVVNNKSYAAQIVGPVAPLFFDDIGCLVQYERTGKVAAADLKARFVRSVEGNAWLDVSEAFWVQTKDVRTPMGYGFHAFTDKKAAEAFAKGKKMAQVLTWAEVTKAVPASGGMGKM